MYVIWQKIWVLKIEIAVQISFNLYFNCLLPPANEVWDKVMFLGLSLFTGVCLRGGGAASRKRRIYSQGEGSVSRGYWGDPQLENKVVMFLHLSVCSRGGGGSASGESASGKGICVQEVCLWGTFIQGRGLHPGQREAVSRGVRQPPRNRKVMPSC